MPDVSGYTLELAQKDAERQERILVGAADELMDELTKLVKQATPQPTGDTA